MATGRKVIPLFSPERMQELQQAAARQRFFELEAEREQTIERLGRPRPRKATQ